MSAAVVLVLLVFILNSASVIARGQVDVASLPVEVSDPLSPD